MCPGPFFCALPSAGDLERYLYCAHNWYLAKHGVDPGGDGSHRGIKQHAAKGKALQAYQARDKERRRALSWSFRGLLMLGSVMILTLEVLYFEATVQGIILLVTGLVLISASTGLLIIAIDQEKKAKRALREAGERHGRVIDSDLAGAGRLLEDPDWDLTGTPDYIMETDSGLVPVEVKTGKTPARPFESHAMQVACYLRLLEATTGRSPKYGLLTYPDRIFQVQWDAARRASLRKLVDAIHAAELEGKADRDHAHVGRCRGCARRDECDQRLA